MLFWKSISDRFLKGEVHFQSKVSSRKPISPHWIMILRNILLAKSVLVDKNYAYTFWKVWPQCHIASHMYISTRKTSLHKKFYQTKFVSLKQIFATFSDIFMNMQIFVPPLSDYRRFLELKDELERAELCIRNFDKSGFVCKLQIHTKIPKSRFLNVQLLGMLTSRNLQDCLYWHQK